MITHASRLSDLQWPGARRITILQTSQSSAQAVGVGLWEMEVSLRRPTRQEGLS